MFDFAVFNCLRHQRWCEEGVFWGIKYALKRLQRKFKLNDSGCGLVHFMFCFCSTSHHWHFVSANLHNCKGRKVKLFGRMLIQSCEGVVFVIRWVNLSFNLSWYLLTVEKKSKKQHTNYMQAQGATKTNYKLLFFPEVLKDKKALVCFP